MSILLADDEIFNVRKPKKFIWKPKEDITAYELALTMPIWHLAALQRCSNYVLENKIQSLPENIKRHFEEI